MEAHKHNQALPCRCGGQPKIFGPCEFAPRSHWGIYCSENACEKMASADSLNEVIEMWNEEQVIYHY